VIRITDTAPAAGSKTLATTVVLIDRGIGLLGLALVAAMGASAGLGPAKVGPVGPGMLWAGFGVAAMLATPALLNPEGFTRILQPLRVLHPEWVGERLERLTAALSRFKESPAALASCFVGAIGVQVMLVAFYLGHLPRGGWPVQNQGELALLYACIFAFFATHGGGAFSLDGRIGKRRW